MNKIGPIIAIAIIALVVSFGAGMGPGPALAGVGDYIIEANEAKRLLADGGAVLVDMQDAEDFAAGHIAGAVNIMRDEIVVNSPYPNLLPEGDQLAAVLGERGIANDNLIIIYDDAKNMNAARLWWTLKVYGHQSARVVSGGFEALVAAGMPVSTDPVAPDAVDYQVGEPDLSSLATIEDIMELVDNPRDDVILLDTRSREEFNDGTIPGAVLKNFEDNNFADGRYKPAQHILIQYKERGITADKEIIIFCAVSVRGAQTYLALYNAGYRNLKLYDGAWVEYSDLMLVEGEEECDDSDPAADPDIEDEVEEEIEAPGG